jgi:8-oxo-dGTP pyrophosphatase MutT (NUDIX family)
MTTEPRQAVGTAAAARAVGVDASTLWRWQRAGYVTPAYVTRGGHARWNIEQLRHQLANAQEAPLTEAPTTPEPQPVAAAIVTSDGRVLAGQRHDGRPPWTFIAGEVEPGESPADAAVREVKEEAGLVVAVTRTIGRRVHPKTGRTMIYLACEPTEGTSVHVGDPEELAAVEWLTLAQADELLPGMFEPVRLHLDDVL